MRYQNPLSFQKHLEEAAPSHFCFCYLLMIPDDYERQKMVQGLLKKLPKSSPIFLMEEKVGRKEVLDALSPPLFGEMPVVVVGQAEKMAKDFSLDFECAGLLILCAKSKVSFAKSVERGGVILDLTEEKPWDREKRIAEELIFRALGRGKKISFQTVKLLLDTAGLDLALLDQEIDKLSLFVGERPSIEPEDIAKISTHSKSHSLWQIAEAIVWGEGGWKGEAPFPALVPLLRSQLELGKKIASLEKEGASSEVWRSVLPKMWPKMLEKRRLQVRELGNSYFEKGMRLLFEVELLSRKGSNQFEALLDFFHIRLRSYVR